MHAILSITHNINFFWILRLSHILQNDSTNVAAKQFFKISPFYAFPHSNNFHEIPSEETTEYI